jgi:uncharacterized protein (UPF0333 family)
MINKLFKNRNGYTLLFAVIVSAVVLSVGISILNISKKEFLLASAARESVSAFYAADSGLECAIYNYKKISEIFDSSNYSEFFCLGQRFYMPPSLSGTDPADPTIGEATYIFYLRSPSVDNQSCSKVTVKKYFEYDVDLGEKVPATNIESRGYNTGWNASRNECNIDSPRRVQRAINYKI